MGLEPNYTKSCENPRHPYNPINPRFRQASVRLETAPTGVGIAKRSRGGVNTYLQLGKINNTNNPIKEDFFTMGVIR